MSNPDRGRNPVRVDLKKGTSSGSVPVSSPLAPILVSAARYIAGSGVDHESLGGRLLKLRVDPAEGRFHLAVLGQIDRGKRTPLSALLSGSVLPTTDVPLTEIPTFARSGRKPGDFVGPRGGRAARSAESASASDTAGLLTELCAAPRVIEVGLDISRRVQTKVPMLFFVVNEVDCLSPQEPREALGFLRDVLSGQAGIPAGVPILCISARQRLNARVTRNEELHVGSGIRLREFPEGYSKKLRVRSPPRMRSVVDRGAASGSRRREADAQAVLAETIPGHFDREAAQAAATLPARMQASRPSRVGQPYSTLRCPAGRTHANDASDPT